MIDQLKTAFALILFSVLIYFVDQNATLSSISKEKGLNFENLIYRNGLIYYKFSEKLASGQVIAGSEQGLLKNGIWHGLKETFEDGKKVKIEEFRDGEKQGIEKTYYASGKLQAELSFKDGKKDGLSRMWHENGALMGKFNFDNGLKNGSFEMWHKNGEISETGSYLHDLKTGTFETCDASGRIHSSVSYINGEQHGPEVYYNLGGDGYYRELMYNQGKIVDGIYITKYSNGDTKEINRYVSGKLDGRQKEIGKAKAKQVLNYSNGKLHGRSEQFNEKGELSDFVNYKHGELDGICHLTDDIFGKRTSVWSEGVRIEGDTRTYDCNPEIWYLEPKVWGINARLDDTKCKVPST